VAGLIFQEVEIHSYIVYYGDRMYACGNRLPGAASSPIDEDAF